GAPPPSPARRSSDLATTLFTAAESLFTMDSGVPLGIARAYQESRRKFFRPYSPKVGTSGSSGERSGAATASARTWPALIWGNTEDRKSTRLNSSHVK